MNVAGNVNPDMMGSHGGKFALAGAFSRSRREEAYRSRQFRDDRRLSKRDAQERADLMTHEANLNDYAQRRAHGVDSDAELQAGGGHIGAAGRAAAAASTVMGPNGQLIGRSYGYNPKTGAVNMGGFTMGPGKSTKQADSPAAPENERPTNVANPADTNPNAGRQFDLSSDVQGVYELRNSPAGKQTKKAGQARAMEWGPLSKEDKEMDALRTTPAQAQQDELDLAPKPAKKTKSSKVSSEEVL
jgi:hypothetical protein